jgi:hypothetical protein
MQNLCECGCGVEIKPGRRYVHGHTLVPNRANTIMDIMGRLVVQENGCALWPGVRNKQGYGQVGYQGKQWRVHDLMYEHFIGPVPEGLVLDHIVCDTPSCGNFAHLKVSTQAENVLRGQGPCARNARKTHCKNGHPFAGENLGHMANGERYCKTCGQAKWAKYKAANRERELERQRKRHAEDKARLESAGVVIPPKKGTQTHCPSGHEYTPENTRLNKAGWRYCWTCRQEYNRKQYERRKLEDMRPSDDRSPAARALAGNLERVAGSAG